MDDNCIFNWQSVDALPLFSATLEVMLEETEQQHHYIQYLKNGTYQIEKGLIKRIVTFYQTQLDKVMYYDEQLQRWLSEASKRSNNKLLNDISELKKIVEVIKKLSHSIITLAKESDVDEGDNATVLTVNRKMFLDFVDGKFEEKK